MLNTRYIASELRLSHWSSIMRERNESGLSIKAFCESRGIQLNVCFYWQRKLRVSACEELLQRQLAVESQVPAVLPSGWALCEEEPAMPEQLDDAVIIEIGKCRLHVHAYTSPELLEKTCRVLMSLC
jgi:hypothetical protein